ncbi:MAG TPA: hypothetical protein VKN99_05250 [Polyangia bacterium]|nr:hypothetical protein [Polyangia bacterium]
MGPEDRGLRGLGIEVITDAEDPRVHGECVRIARRVRQLQKKVIGLVPASAEVAVPPLAVQLGLALVELSGATVAFVDANVRWPAMSALVEGEPAGTDSLFATRWLRGSLALLVPPRAGDAGAGVPQLKRLIEHGAELFAHVLVDLTGFDRLGEHLSAVALCEGVLIVARAGRTREPELRRLAGELPSERNLGVVLIG